MGKPKHDSYEEKKWCASCNSYQPYLMSVNHSYCMVCGSQVRLFSKADAARFNDQIQKRRWREAAS